MTAPFKEGHFAKASSLIARRNVSIIMKRKGIHSSILKCIIYKIVPSRHFWQLSNNKFQLEKGSKNFFFFFCTYFRILKSPSLDTQEYFKFRFLPFFTCSYFPSFPKAPVGRAKYLS